MASTLTKSEFLDALQECLLAALPGADLSDFGDRPRRGKVGGVVAWEGFEHLDQIERQNLVWAALGQRFTPAELRRISILMTFTPQEIKWMDEG